MAVKTGTVIVGGGQAGLSLSAHLTARDHAHVVLERGRVGERWRSERWDSLHMLTPNWINQLDGAPGHADPEGFLARDGFVDYLERYASSIGMPVREHVDVLSVERHRRRFRVRTDDGEWIARQVVVATGDCGVPYRPPAASSAPAELAQLDAAQYRRPDQLAAGSVLVVGAGPSGLQIASELRRAGREVVLAVGATRSRRAPLPRSGHLSLARAARRSGTLGRRRAGRSCGAHLASGSAGQNGGEQLDLATVSELGVTACRPAHGLRRSLGELRQQPPSRPPRTPTIGCSSSSRGSTHTSPSRRMPRQIPPAEQVARVRRRRRAALPRSPERPACRRSSGRPVTGASTRGCTFRPSIRRARSFTAAASPPVPGLFVLGLRFQSRRTSHTIGGVGRDAQAIADRIAAGASCGAEARLARPSQSLVARLAADALVTAASDRCRRGAGP